jgi:hypothetical protein
VVGHDGDAGRRRAVLRIRIVLVLGLLMLAGLPGSRPVPSVPAPWAQEAVEWFEARDEAARLGIPNLLRFVAPDVVHDDDSLAEVAVGRAEYGSHLQQDDQEWVDEAATDVVYLDVTGALVERPGPSDVLGDLTAVQIDHGMMTRVSETGNAQHPIFLDTPENVAARALAGAYVQAWSSPDPDAIRALYASGAEIVDSLLR